ncbi:O-antigen ligase family protein [Nocardioides xinjiangensis]|uniref:O-antigen ligase family protein n=1 Tax=Nocardioides xinjiangensis TaxID=2817376 RepID=UPI001B3045FA|nr:O-antigen ligase family protein [Nocardioides sp. SYSU D00514]
MEQLTLGLVAAAALLIVALATRPRAVDMIVIGLPVAGVLGGAAVEANISPADIFLPFALLTIVSKASSRKASSVTSAGFAKWVSYICVMSVVLLGGLSVRLLVDPLGISFGYGVAAVAKIWVGLTYLAVFAYYGRGLFAGGGDRLLALWARVASVAALAGIAGVGLYAAGVPTTLTLSFRATGGFDDPNLYASYLLVSISLTFAAGARGVVRYPVRLVALQSVALALSGSRAAIPALALGVLSALALGRGRLVAKTIFRWVLLLTLGVGVAAWRFPSLLGLDAFSRAVDASGNAENDIRFLLWRTAYNMWLDHPILGIGIGQFIPTSADYVPGGLSNIPHNTHLSLLAETGLLGWMLVIGLPVVIFVRLSGLAKRTADPTPTWLILGIVSALAMAFTLNLENFRGLWALLGICLAYCSVMRADRAHDERPVARGERLSR